MRIVLTLVSIVWYLLFCSLYPGLNEEITLA